MIVKKSFILKGFSDFEYLNGLLAGNINTHIGQLIFYDIETTGLSRSSSYCYLIGTVKQEEATWALRQWLAENPEEEAMVLEEFSHFLKGCTAVAQYNGSRFDQPYLESRYQAYGLSCPLLELPSLDLYQQFRPLSPFLKLNRMKQPDMEFFLGFPERTNCNGKDCIRIYKQYIQKKEEGLLKILLGHNAEDLSGLVRLLPILSYKCLLSGNYQVRHVSYEDNKLFFFLDLPVAVPKAVSNWNSDFYLSCEGKDIKLQINLHHSRMRLNYPNFKDYSYLPSEDTAIPKSLSKFMDRSLFVPATPETCYTWIACDSTFLSNPQKQKEYLQRQLPIFLSSL